MTKVKEKEEKKVVKMRVKTQDKKKRRKKYLKRNTTILKLTLLRKMVQDSHSMVKKFKQPLKRVQNVSWLI